MHPRRRAPYTTLMVSLVLSSCTLGDLPPALPEASTPMSMIELPVNLLPGPDVHVPLTVVTVPELIDMRELEPKKLNYQALRKQQRRRPPKVSFPSAATKPHSDARGRGTPTLQRISFGPETVQKPHRQEDLWDEFDRLPRPTGKPEDPVKVIEALNTASLIKPRREWSQGGIVHYPYEVGYTYLVQVAVDHPTVLFLPPGEKLAGRLTVDKNKFDIIYNTDFGKAAGTKQRTQAILIQGQGLLTTATTPLLTESGLALWLQLQEVERTSMRGVTWQVPEEVRPVQEGIQTARSDSQPVPGIPALNLDRLHRTYTIEVTKGSPPWVPEAVFDDGQRTLIKFKESPAFGTVPAVFSLHANGEPAVVEWMPYEVPEHPDKPAYYVIGGIWPRLLLKGADDMTVTITRGPTRRTLAQGQEGAH